MPKGFAWPSFHGTSSSVIQSPKDWRDYSILVPHECLRWWDQQLLLALDTYDPIAQPGTAWKTKLLFGFIDDYYIPCIHHHHDAEEKIYGPGIEQKGGMSALSASTPSSRDSYIGPEHEHILISLKKLTTFRTRIESGGSTGEESLADFKQAFCNFVSYMESHLANEEVFYPAQLLACGMTEKEEAALVGKIIQGLGLGGNRKLLPAIVYAMCMWKGEQQAMAWLNDNVPAPIRFLYHNFWLADFEQNQISVFAALQTGVPPLPQRQTSFWFPQLLLLLMFLGTLCIGYPVEWLSKKWVQASLT